MGVVIDTWRSVSRCSTACFNIRLQFANHVVIVGGDRAQKIRSHLVNEPFAKVLSLRSPVADVVRAGVAVNALRSPGHTRPFRKGLAHHGTPSSAGCILFGFSVGVQ
jgi:hypothetical protein